MPLHYFTDSQQAHNVETVSIQRWLNVETLNQRWIDVVSTLCARWGLFSRGLTNKMTVMLLYGKISFSIIKERAHAFMKRYWKGLNSFGPKVQAFFFILFFFFTNYRLERRLYVKLKDWLSNVKQRRSWWDGSLWAVSSGPTLFAKDYYYYRLWQWRVNILVFFQTCLVGESNVVTSGLLSWRPTPFWKRIRFKLFVPKGSKLFPCKVYRFSAGRQNNSNKFLPRKCIYIPLTLALLNKLRRHAHF